MRKKVGLCLLLIIFVFLFAGCSCAHEWESATCTLPKTCPLCGETEGEPLGHAWLDATCVAPQTCSVCMETQGIPTVHAWSDASCMAPMTCSVCATTQGDLLPHTPGEVTSEPDYVRAVSINSQHCANCDTVMDVSKQSISLIQDKLFLFSPEVFVDRLNYIYAEAGYTDWSAELVSMDEEDYTYFGAFLRNGPLLYARVTFNTPETDPETKQILTELGEADKNTPIICSVQVAINFRDISEARLAEADIDADLDTLAGDILDLYSDQGEALMREILVPVYMACDPQLTVETATEHIRNAWSTTNGLFPQDPYASNCGELSIEHVNLFLVNLSHWIFFNTSEDYYLWHDFELP